MDRGIDHLVLAVRDLDRAAALYERLGFTLTPRALHPWGTANRLVQFQGGNFLELLAVAEPDKIGDAAAGDFAFGAYNRDFLARREGFSMLVVDSADAAAEARRYAARGLPARPPFHFGRDARLPDGSTARVAFTLAFATDPALPEAPAFACQQHAPDLFWKPDYQRHANGATAVTEVVLRATDLAAPMAFMARVLDDEPMRQGTGHATFETARGRVTLRLPASFARAYPGIADPAWPEAAHYALFRVGGVDAAAQARRLAAAGIPCAAIGDDAVVPAGAAFGVAIAFGR
jgi:catechol 2,3-dioxygenase-like lactoylglutathione lyase family enzyme